MLCEGNKWVRSFPSRKRLPTDLLSKQHSKFWIIPTFKQQILATTINMKHTLPLLLINIVLSFSA